jgi:hypothetical protein
MYGLKYAFFSEPNLIGDSLELQAESQVANKLAAQMHVDRRDWSHAELSVRIVLAAKKNDSGANSQFVVIEFRKNRCNEARTLAMQLLK